MTSYKRYFLKTLMLVAFGFFASQGFSQERPCKGDVDAFCKDVVPGGGAIIDCLNKNKSKLSQACLNHQKWMKENFKEKKEERQEKKSEILAQCAADHAKFCHENENDKKHPFKCLVRHKESLSEDCKKSLPERTNMKMQNLKNKMKLEKDVPTK